MWANLEKGEKCAKCVYTIWHIRAELNALKERHLDFFPKNVKSSP